MKLYSTEESKKFITVIDDVGSMFEYENAKDPGVWLSANPIALELAQSVLDDIDFPLNFLDIPLFLTPFRLMQRDLKRGLWQGSEYNGRAYHTHILYGARREKEITKETIGDLIIHEIGHGLMYKTMNCTYENHMTNKKFKEYIKSRGIPKNFTAEGMWAKRPAEIFAEDFRYLFGDKYMSDPPYDSYQFITPPTGEIKQFMLDLIKK